MQFINPQRGHKKDMLDNAQKNALIALKKINFSTKEDKKKPQTVLSEMQATLSLSKTPNYILGFDISHFYGTQIVASCVAFVDGIPEKSLYRRFNIKSLQSGKSNDPASIAEAVERRIKNIIKDEERIPDLLIIDGGFAQLRAAHIALNKCSNAGNIACISLAKRYEEIYMDPNYNSTIQLSAHDPVRHLCQRVRDESTSICANLSTKETNKTTYNISPLEGIAGLGPKNSLTL